MDKYASIIAHWGGDLVKHVVPEISLYNVNIPESSRWFLMNVGLPMIDSSYAQSFIPFTSVQAIEKDGKIFYLLGDILPKCAGVAFVGILEGCNTLYRIRKRRDLMFETVYLNDNLESFLFFIANYNLFQKKFGFNRLIVRDEIRQEYSNLKIDLSKEDPKAMEDMKFLWRNMIEHIEVEYGDYLLNDSVDGASFTEDDLPDL